MSLGFSARHCRCAEGARGVPPAAKLIAGFWDITGGTITLDGTDFRQIPLEQLGRQVAYVPRTITSSTARCGKTSSWAARAPPMRR